MFNDHKGSWVLGCGSQKVVFLGKGVLFSTRRESNDEVIAPAGRK